MSNDAYLDAQDMLDKRLAQLYAGLMMLRGDNAVRDFEKQSDEIQEGYLWLLSDLAKEAKQHANSAYQAWGNEQAQNKIAL